ncbi:MAG: hypothetical protein HQL75_00505 [Magnetococcales bacterium]|nr:hypothetical protein [Magnetococcales bacterium]
MVSATHPDTGAEIQATGNVPGSITTPIYLSKGASQKMQKNMTRQQRHLSEVSKRFPDAWKGLEKLFFGRGKELPEWPMWCWVPIAAGVAVAAEGGLSIPDAEMSGSVIVGIGAWRLTQGVYRIDPTVRRALMSTPLTGEIPVDLFYRLPEWCLYIEIPDHPSMTDLHGIYVFLEWDTQSRGAELRLLLDRDKSLDPAVMHLIPGGTLDACLSAATDRAVANALMSGLEVGFNSEEFRDFWEPIISLVLYLCSDEPAIRSLADIDRRPRHPAPAKTKKGMRLFPPDNQTIWDVGASIGEEIRSASTQDPKDGSHESPKVHIRRAHWHTYWVGKEGTVGRRRILKWIHPVLVGGRLCG